MIGDGVLAVMFGNVVPRLRGVGITFLLLELLVGGEIRVADRYRMRSRSTVQNRRTMYWQRNVLREAPQNPLPIAILACTRCRTQRPPYVAGRLADSARGEPSLSATNPAIAMTHFR